MRRSPAPTPAVPSPLEARRSSLGFTLVELVVCLGVIAVLCGILLPSLRTTRESASKVRCLTHARQIAVAIAAYHDIHGQMPPSKAIDPTNPPPRPGELMATRMNSSGGGEWQGIGRLHGFLGPACECMYCPSHRGRHAQEVYAERLRNPGNDTIYSNYHYCGHLQHWRDPSDPLHNTPTRLDAGRDLVLLTDGMRTVEDFNHVTGLNRVFGDLSAEWYRDSEVPGESIRSMLPSGDLQATIDGSAVSAVWSRLTDPSGNR